MSAAHWPSARHVTELVAELEAQCTALLQAVETIEVQLSSRNRCDREGKRLPPHAYWSWRLDALHARRNKLEMYRRVKAQLKEARASLRALDERDDRDEGQQPAP